MKEIIIDDIKIIWDSDKTLTDISDMILVYLYGNSSYIKKDRDSIDRRKKRLENKLKRLCKSCGNPLDIDDKLRCKSCKEKETKRYIPINKRLFKSKNNIEYSYVYLHNFIIKCDKKTNECNHLKCLECDFLF